MHVSVCVLCMYACVCVCTLYVCMCMCVHIMWSAINKDQKLVSYFLKVEYFIDYYTAVH